MPPRTRTLNILDVEFHVSGDLSLSEYCDAFADAYETTDAGTPPSARIAISVSRDLGRARETGQVVQIHRSKTHAYWNLEGRAERTGNGLRVTVPSRGATIFVHDGGRRVEASFAPEVSTTIAGEMVFHLCRSLTLPVRDKSRGWLLHASAVEFDDRAVIFVGDQGAGKSTLLVEAALRHGCKPITNDRVLVTNADAPAVVSWPGYMSLCEGTILRYKELERAALAYETSDVSYRTMSFPGPLSMVFTKAAGTKRMYPMSWFTNACSQRYVSTSRLGAIVMVRLEPDQETKLTLVEAGDPALLALVERNNFDSDETAFLPWHGLAESGGGALGSQALLRLLGKAGVPICRLQINVSDLPRLSEHLTRIRSWQHSPQ